MRQRNGDRNTRVSAGRFGNGGAGARFVVALATALTVVSAADGRSADESSAGDWNMLGRTSEQHHFSPLKSIDASNVGRLGLAWHADLPTADGLLANPLVDGGLVYQIGAYSQ